MRLVNRETLEIESYRNEDAPDYIILSHRWQGEETSMQNFTVQRKSPHKKRSPGTTKVIGFCEQARHFNATHVWVDTVCIDKTSSAELQESINSMYLWYKQATECVVYLVDVDIKSSPKTDGDADEDVKHQLAQSEWFTRGWTLQELLAPQQLVFVDRHWTRLGSREKFADLLQTITGINPSCYGSQEEIAKTTVAERMSWLSSRKTTRVEDLAYCMIGIFDVNISMLYGEGPKAFVRLQKEIIQEIDDDSIFIWQGDGQANSVLAPHPSCFSFCRGKQVEKNSFFERESPRWTAKGLEIEHYDERQSHISNKLTIVLNCTVDAKQACIPIVRINNPAGVTNRWRRTNPSEVKLTSSQSISKPPTAKDTYQTEMMNVFRQHTTMQMRQPGGNFRGNNSNNMSMTINQRNPPMSASKAQLDFEHEMIRYKVCVV